VLGKPKILITGASGYIGCELGDELNPDLYDLVFVDFNFLPSIEEKLKLNKIKTINENFFNLDISEYDLIVHLAYITDVTRVSQEKLISNNLNPEDVNVKGVNYIFQNASNNCKIIYPSTHVVFEGIKKDETNILLINENETPVAKTVYSKQKVQNEIDILNSNKNYIIFRLGSVYGLNESINTKILTNLFSFNAAKGNALKLFSGGLNHKPTVCVKDVARAIRFMIEDHFSKQQFNRQIYHLSHENLTVKEIAEICKEYIPLLNIIETNDPIPNLGYALDNKKITRTGFLFNEQIKYHILNMINFWRKHEA